jgi:release factor glutamine methyltransferase
MISLREALTRAASQLAAHPDLRATAVPDATLLFMHTLGLDRAALLAHPERPVTRDEMALLQSATERRLAFEPIQYILGQQEFYGLTLRVTPAVLIPRPETELLVEAVLARVNPTASIADIGTGSGAIAIALAHHLPAALITALDLSAEALAVAQQNAATHSLETRLRFLRSDLLAAIPPGETFDAIVSNPPYIPTSDAPTLHPQVRDHEPAQALFAGPDGLEIYRRLIPQARALLNPGGLLALEIGHGQQPAIAALLEDWQAVEFLPDLQGIPRVALARTKNARVPHLNRSLIAIEVGSQT